ncbi:MAG: hypothetical protein M1816_007965 [Peltula sp. TS41687]|nr:MAG: hypothetical protein M1816_007965 [Peltula sp. TS41687]
MAFPGPPTGSGPSQRTSFPRLMNPMLLPQGQGFMPQPRFDVFEWYPAYQSCQKYFLDVAQNSEPVQAVAAFVNIWLPNQRETNPIASFHDSFPPLVGPPRPGAPRQCCVSLFPYIRRLVATGMDKPKVLHGFFGDNWTKGIGSIHEQERRNYLFAAKSGGWASVKREYDNTTSDTVPFLVPLYEPEDAELEAADQTWSAYLAMEDWMIGSRAPENMEDYPTGRGKAPVRTGY